MKEVISLNKDTLIEYNSEDIDRLKADCYNAQELSDIYENPVVQTFFSVLESLPIAIPGTVSLVKSTIGKAISDFQRKKQKELLDYIIKSDSVTSDQVSNIEFIMNLRKTCEAVNRLSTNDKVKYYGNLLRNGYLSDRRIDNNFFDECFEYIDSMSYREILWLWKYREFCGDELQNNEKWYDFKRTLSKESGVEENVISGIGGNLCDNVAEVLFGDGEEIIDNCFKDLSKSKREKVYKSKKQIVEMIPNHILDYWEKIEKLSFEWGCCLDVKAATRILQWK